MNILFARNAVVTTLIIVITTVIFARRNAIIGCAVNAVINGGLNKMALNRLGLKENFLLTTYVQSNYVNLKLNDVDFAKRATEELGFAVSPSHVKARRISLDISSTIVRDGHSIPANDRIKRLEERVAKLEKMLEGLS